MPDSVGVLAKAAFRKDRGLYGGGPAITYPTVPGASELAATHQVPFSSESLTRNVQLLKSPALLGSAQAIPAGIVSKMFSGSMEGPLAWVGWERLLMAAFGYENPDSSPYTLAAGAYAHLFELDNDLQDQPWTSGDERAAGGWSASDRKVRRGMLGVSKQLEDWVFSSVMVSKVTVSGTPAESKIALDLIPHGLYRGSYNSANWALPAGSVVPAMFSQLVVMMGTTAGGAGSMYAVYPSEFEITADLKLKGDDITTELAPSIVQPVRADMLDVGIKLTFPRYNTAATGLYTLLEANTEMAVSLILTGPQIAATGQYHKYRFYASSVRMKSPSGGQVQGPGALTFDVEMEAHRPGTDIFAAGSYHSIPIKKDSPLKLIVQNAFATNYLLET